MDRKLYLSFADRLEELKRCPLCDGERLALARLQPEAPYGIRQCDDCGILFTSPRVRPDAVGELYAGIVSDPAKLEKRLASNMRRAERHYRRLKRFVRPPGKLLEIGAGDGSFMSCAKRDGWDVTGFEYSQKFIDIARATYGVELGYGDFMSATLAPGSFNAIAAFQTIEHMYDPRAFLRHCHELLAPGGVLMMSTPNVLSYPARNRGIETWKVPQHVFFFTPRTIVFALRDAGFTPFGGQLRMCAALEESLNWKPWNVGSVANVSRDLAQPHGLFAVGRKPKL